jgi:uncharacterized membrane protein YkoI
MKSYCLSSILAAGLMAAGSSVNAAPAQWKELPPALQNTLRSQAKTNEVQSISKETRNGKTYYRVEVKKQLVLGEDGALVDNLPALDSRKVSMNEVPANVRQVVRSRAGRARIEDVDRDVRNGRVEYEVAFKLNGQNQELRVAEDGTIVKDINPPPTGLPAQGATGQGASANKATTTPAGPQANVNLSASTKIPFNDIPAVVQKTIKAQAGGAEIEDVEHGTYNGRTVYEAAFKKNGQNTELQVYEDGTLVVNPATTPK